ALSLAKRLLRAHEVNETVEQDQNVVRTGAGFRMALKAKGRCIRKFEALQRTVKERLVGDSCIRRQRGRVDLEPVVLAGDENPTAIQLLNRMIGAVMTEFHLGGLRADSQSENLVSKANTKYGDLPLQELTRRLD